MQLYFALMATCVLGLPLGPEIHKRETIRSLDGSAVAAVVAGVAADNAVTDNPRVFGRDVGRPVPLVAEHHRVRGHRGPRVTKDDGVTLPPVTSDDLLRRKIVGSDVTRPPVTDDGRVACPSVDDDDLVARGPPIPEDYRVARTSSCHFFHRPPVM